MAASTNQSAIASVTLPLIVASAPSRSRIWRLVRLLRAETPEVLPQRISMAFA